MTELSNWIRLTCTNGIGCETARKLLLAFGLPHQIFSATLNDLKQVVTERQAQALCLPLSETTQHLIEQTERWCDQPNNHFITLADPNYPTNLLEIPDPPTVLYVKGRLDLLAATSVAVVGSRNATEQGIKNARQFSASLSHAGITIISGMALGIDTAAHEGALAGVGATVAVIGTGADKVYPARNHELAHQIAAQGCIVSEYALGTPPIASNFPRRNRLISGLAQGVLVIEAAAQSGSLITARMAAEQGRDVFAIPGSIHSPLAKGCHQLIKQGAKLVETAQDILQELRLDHIAPNPSIAPTPSSARAAAETVDAIALADDDSLLTHMGYDPVHPDELALRSHLASSVLSEKLLLLELEGLVEIMPGGLYRRLN